ncbi:MAG: NnrU family protein [Pseudomonadota bacterium]|nr:NnrU family protein [Pseudomonadota bacterium]
MLMFLAGLVIFYGVHVFSAIRSRAPEKDLRTRMGYGPFMGLYSVLSLIGFILIIYGYGATRGLGLLYNPPTWLAHINLVLTIPALILLVASQLPAGYIKKASKHPMLLAVKLWALGHLLANGEINSVILFGSFLAYAVFDRIMVKRRGDNGPRPETTLNPMMDVISVGAGAIVWAAIALWLHPILFGVVAIPG